MTFDDYGLFHEDDDDEDNEVEEKNDDPKLVYDSEDLVLI